MTLPTDILERLRSDFGNNYEKAVIILENSVTKNDYLNHPRIIRCVIFLANKNLEGLKTSIEQAKLDKRDVMLWAEYINLKDNETPKRIRDFNRRFEDCEKDVKE